MHVNPSPRNMELFYLRLLLLQARGATGFDDLKTIDGRLHETFREACTALGLEDGGDTFLQAMAEVAAAASPRELRIWFATLLAKCRACNGEELWELHRIALSDDFRRGGQSQTAAFRRARDHITQLVTEMGSVLSVQLSIQDEDDADDDDELSESDMAEVPESAAATTTAIHSTPVNRKLSPSDGPTANRQWSEPVYNQWLRWHGQDPFVSGNREGNDQSGQDLPSLVIHCPCRATPSQWDDLS